MSESISKISSKDFISNRINKNELQKVCQDFESIFIHQMIKAMRKTVPKTGFFGKASGEELFESFFDTELSKVISKKGGFGIGRMLYESFIKRIENHNGSDALNFEEGKRWKML